MDASDPFDDPFWHLHSTARRASCGYVREERREASQPDDPSISLVPISIKQYAEKRYAQGQIPSESRKHYSDLGRATRYES